MIKLYVKELLYDVEQQTWKCALEHIDDKERRNEAQLNHNDQNDNDMMLRWCESGVASLHVKFRTKLVDPNTGRGFWEGFVDTDTNDEESEITPYSTNEHNDKLKYDLTTFDFHLGCNADEKALAMLFHRFIVRYCVWQWSRLHGLKNLEQSLIAELKSIEDEISDGLFDISLPKKPHIHFLYDYIDSVTYTTNS